MAEIRKAEPGSDAAGAPPSPGEAAQPGGTVQPGGTASTNGSAPAAPPPPPRHNLPLKTIPICGRREEMKQIAATIEKARGQGRPGRVEIVGRPGVGATTVAVELARRAGARFAGGAWFIDASMGADLGWAEVAAVRGRGRTKNLAATVRLEKETFAEGPQTILVLDGITSGEHLLAAMPLESRTPPFVFIVCEKRTGITEDVIQVSDVPPHAPRKLCQAMMQGAPEGMKTPDVRSIDGLGLTASIAARTAMALQGRAGPLMIEDTRSAALRIVPLIAQNPACLELLLIASVMHPSRIAVDALFGAVESVRSRTGRGSEPKPEEVGQAVLVLARAGLLDPQDERRVSMHPIVQETVRSMAQGEADIAVALEAAATGLCEEAEAAMEGDGSGDGLVDVATCGLHQLRHVEPQLTGAAQERVRTVRTKLETALGAVA